MYYTYDGLLNILGPDYNDCKKIKSRTARQGKILHLIFTHYEGGLIGENNFNFYKTLYPDFVMYLKRWHKKRNIDISFEKVNTPAMDLLFFFDQLISFDKKTIDKVVSFVKRLIKENGLSCYVYLHPSQSSASDLGRSLRDTCGARIMKNKKNAEIIYRENRPKVVISHTSSAIINISSISSIPSISSFGTSCYMSGLDEIINKRNGGVDVLETFEKLGVKQI